MQLARNLSVMAILKLWDWHRKKAKETMAVLNDHQQVMKYAETHDVTLPTARCEIGDLANHYSKMAFVCADALEPYAAEGRAWSRKA